MTTGKDEKIGDNIGSTGKIAAAPMGNCCSGGGMRELDTKHASVKGGVPEGVAVIAPAFQFAKEHGVAPLGNCCNGGAQ